MAKNICLITILFTSVSFFVITLYLLLSTFMIIKYNNKLDEKVIEALSSLDVKLQDGYYIVYDHHIQYFSIEIYNGTTKIDEYSSENKDAGEANSVFYQYFNEKCLVIYMVALVILLVIIIINTFILIRRIYQYIYNRKITKKVFTSA